MASYNKIGSVKIRKDGRTELRVSIDGISKSFYGKNEAEARRKHRIYLQNEEKDSVKYSIMSLQDYIEYWLVKYKFNAIKDSSYDRIENIFNVHIKNSTIGKRKIRDVTTDDIQDFVTSKTSSLSYSSIKKLVEVFSPCFRHAVIQEIIPKNPMLGFSMPKRNIIEVKTKVIDLYPEEDVDKIIKSASTERFELNPKRYRYAPMFAFLLNTGLRLGECLALTELDIDFRKRLLYVNKTISMVKNRDRYESDSVKVQIVTSTKTENGYRVLPLNDVAIESLHEIMRRNEVCNVKQSNLIFSNYNGELLSMRSVQQTFEKICKDINIQHKGIHCCRHNFASSLIRNGIDIKVVSDLMGHGNVIITYNRYVHTIKEQRAQAINMINLTGGIKDGSNMGQTEAC